MDNGYFYVRPTNSVLLEQDSSASKILLEDIFNIASIAVCIGPKKEDFTDILGYLSSLEEYFKNEDNCLYNVYRKLSVSHYGLTFLCTVIKLMVLERKFREYGIDEYDANLYNATLVDFQGQLELNKKMFENEVKLSK